MIDTRLKLDDLKDIVIPLNSDGTNRKRIYKITDVTDQTRTTLWRHKFQLQLSTLNCSVELSSTSFDGILRYDDIISLSVIPTDMDYSFKGWADGNIDNPRIFIIKDNLNLSVVCTIDYYDLTYDSNYGTYKTETRRTTKSVGFTIESASDIGFTRPQYKFVKWNTKRDGSGVSYNVGDRIDAQNITLYAIWKLISQVYFEKKSDNFNNSLQLEPETYEISVIGGNAYGYWYTAWIFDWWITQNKYTYGGTGASCSGKITINKNETLTIKTITDMLTSGNYISISTSDKSIDIKIEHGYSGDHGGYGGHVISTTGLSGTSSEGIDGRTDTVNEFKWDGGHGQYFGETTMGYVKIWI